jgi:hypothetical protein
MKRVQLQLDGLANSGMAHGVAQFAIFQDLQIAPAEEAPAVGQRESGGELLAFLTAPGVTDLGATDLVLFEDMVAFRAG